MKNIIEKIKEISIKHKKVLEIVLLLFLMIGGTVGYVLVKNGSINTNPKVTQNVKEDKKSDVTETKTTEAPENTTSNNTSNVTETTNNNVSNNTSNNTYNQPTETPCVPTYTTINHPEVGHYETQVIRDAWDEPVYEMRVVGGHTGRIYNSLDEFDMQDEDGNYTVKDVQVDTIHHDAETQQVWVTDQQAWTETVASGC